MRERERERERERQRESMRERICVRVCVFIMICTCIKNTITPTRTPIHDECFSASGAGNSLHGQVFCFGASIADQGATQHFNLRH